MSDACMRCGSIRLIPELPVLETSKVEVTANPEALIFRNVTSGILYARVCGDCGYTELHTSNHRELYEAYLKANGPQT